MRPIMTTEITLSVLVPAWDEEDAIGTVVRDTLAGCHSVGITAECLVCVDDRTRDRTAEVARHAGALPIPQRSRGLTAAVLEVAEVAVGSVCVVLDGDGQHDGAQVSHLAAPVLAGKADLVTGARDPRSLRSGFGGGWRGLIRYAGARLLGLVAQLALRRSVPDPLTGMFACRRADLLALRERARTAPPGGYKLLLGLLVVASPDRVTHETVPFRPRHGGGSKLGARVIATTLRQIFGVLVSRRSAMPVLDENT